jgi:cobalt/nickel transport system permease protein
VTGIDDSIMDFRQLDLLAAGDSAIHRLDPRIKVLVTLAFIIAVVSFDRYALGALLPFVLFPVAIMAVANLPVRFFVAKVLVASLVAVAIGIFNPLLDRQVLVSIGEVGISGGWISFVSILLRSVLTVSAALLLAATTGFPAICRALSRLGMPQVFVRQLEFMYRYIFVLVEEARRMARARELRSFHNRGMGIGPLSSMVGHLLLRTWERAERVHMAMLCRGFSGEAAARPAGALRRADLFFLLGWMVLFLLLRLYNIPRLLGAFFM